MVLRKCMLLLLIVLLGMGIQPAQAQDETANRLIDLAMQDLSTYLGRTVDRVNSFWEFSINNYSDSSLGCPKDGQTYTQGSFTGYSINIQSQGITYNYRVSEDGAIVIRCTETPEEFITLTPTSPASGPVTTPQPTSVVPVGQPLGSADWWAWGYDALNDTLYLINPDGEQARFQRPRMDGEAVTNASQASVMLSRDSHYLVMRSMLANEGQIFGIYDLTKGAFVKTHIAPPNEAIQFGFLGFRSATPYMFDETGKYVAVGYSNTNFDNQALSTWRVVVYELATGNAVYELKSDNANMPVFEGQDLVFAFPRVVYFGDDVVHVQIIPAFAEGMERFPSIAWHPNANFLEKSLLIASSGDISPITQTAVFPYLDDTVGSIEQFGPFTPFNAVGSGDLDTPTPLWLDAANAHLSVAWAGSDKLVLFTSLSGPTQDFTQWNVLNVESGAVTILAPTIARTAGLPNGFLSVTETGAVAFHSQDTPNISTPVWQLPNADNTQIIWTSFPNVPFGLTGVTLPSTLAGAALCSGAPLSRVTVGGSGATTVIDGTPTRLRQAPGGDILLEMPEGTVFLIVGGPACQGEYTWWQVSLIDGTTGWVAEGDTDIYFIEPR